MHHKKNATWNCLIGGSKKWNKDETLVHAFPSISETFKLHARCTGRTEDCFVVQFNWDMEISFYEMIALIGNTPCPPILKDQLLPMTYNATKLCMQHQKDRWLHPLLDFISQMN